MPPPETIVRMIVKATYWGVFGLVLYAVGLGLVVLWVTGLGFLVADAWWPDKSGLASFIKAAVGLVSAVAIALTGRLVRRKANDKIQSLTNQLEAR